MPELSVVIPALNEGSSLERLVVALFEQQQVRLEVIVADGGSRDGCIERLAQSAARYPGRLTCVASPAGRGRQMNAGRARARASRLLFLHADTQLTDPALLRRATAAFDARRDALGHGRLAGHFGR